MTDGPDDSGRLSLNPGVLALIALGVLILLGVIWYFSGNRNPDQDRLTNPQIAQTDQSKASEICSDSTVYLIIKQQLFSRSAQVRGSDQAEFEKLAGVAVLRMDNPVMESEDNPARVINCSGSLSIDLPPGVAVTGGPGSLTADVDYAVSSGGDAGGMVVQVRNADAIVSSLSTLQRVQEAPIADTNTLDGNVAASVSANVQPGPATGSAGRPSFDCARAETPGEVAVCSDGGLAALDLNMTTQYRRALATASPDQKQLLQTTRDRFLAYRDRCSNRQCIADAYVGRMREIRDIMEGRLTPSR